MGKHGIGAIVKTVEIFAKRHVTNAQITPLYARIRHLKFGNQTIWNLNMVTYVKNGLGLGTDVIKYGLGAIVKIVENFAKRHVTNAQITHLYAKMCHLKFGNPSMKLSMVTYVKNMSDLGINVIKYGPTAITKNVENFAKRHVTNANLLQNQHFHTLPTLTTNYELNNELTC